MDQASITKILEIAKQAPSGDNLQPWRFTFNQEELQFLYKPSPVVEPEYYVTGVYSGAGIMIEYIVIAAASLGFATEVKHNYGFDHEKNELIASFVFKEDSSLMEDKEIQALISAMPKRHTVRLPFETKEIPEEITSDIKRSVSRLGGELTFTKEKSVVDKVAKIVGAGDKYFWNTKEARNALVDSVFLSKREPSRNYGMPASTLGVGALAPVIYFHFKLAKKLPFLWWPIKTKASSDAKSNLHKSGAIGFLKVKRNKTLNSQEDKLSRHDHILGGRAVARMWLTATKNGLVLQPLYHLVAMSTHKNNADLGKEFLSTNKVAMPLINEITSASTEETLVFAFRTGFPKSGSLDYPATPRRSAQSFLSR